MRNAEGHARLSEWMAEAEDAYVAAHEMLEGPMPERGMEALAELEEQAQKEAAR